MSELKEKTLESLKKMASKNKIEGRSLMNKSQLIRALSKLSPKKSSRKTSKKSSRKGSKKTSRKRSMKGGKRRSKKSSKKTSKRSKKIVMKGGALTEDQINALVNRNYIESPMILVSRRENGTFAPERSPIVNIQRANDINFLRMTLRLINGTDVTDDCRISRLDLIGEGQNQILVYNSPRYNPTVIPRLPPQPPQPQLNQAGGKRRSKKSSRKVSKKSKIKVMKGGARDEEIEPLIGRNYELYPMKFVSRNENGSLQDYNELITAIELNDPDILTIRTRRIVDGTIQNIVHEIWILFLKLSDHNYDNATYLIHDPWNLSRDYRIPMPHGPPIDHVPPPQVGGKRRSKKSSKRSKKIVMKGGALTEDQIDALVTRNYRTNPMTLRIRRADGSFTSGQHQISSIRRQMIRGVVLLIIYVNNIGNSYPINRLELSDNDDQNYTYLIVNSDDHNPSVIPHPVNQDGGKRLSKKTSKKILKKTSKKTSRKTSKKTSRKGSKKTSRKGSKKTSRKRSMKGGKKRSKKTSKK